MIDSDMKKDNKFTIYAGSIVAGFLQRLSGQVS